MSTGPKTEAGRERIAEAQRNRWARRRSSDASADELHHLAGRSTASPDEICALVADEPDVKAAVAKLDRATPSTYRDLVGARLAAQARMGIPEAERAPLYSGQIEDFLMPILFRLRPGGERAAVAALRRELTVLYGEFSEAVLVFTLETYRHGGTEALRQAARETAP